MWLSKALQKREMAPRAEKGEVTLSSAENWEATATQSVRNIARYLPYGYEALPPQGEEVLLLPVSDGTAALGVRAKGGTEAGEIALRSAGGASIVLKNDGTVIINHHFIIDREGRGGYAAEAD